ncbi:uncharacterized protein FRV6_06311 [Fusarium oxysporum]|uniref:Uncharacterized protein n=1 Tax=Fusarium oxysporum TaxID=5507 RepID=A0A2H3T0B8_FUSOX|nr:uncharacterized protein FRV6_06311 [Fusarium oxysporum]
MRAESHTSQRANASMPTRFHDYQGMPVRPVCGEIWGRGDDTFSTLS